jgi:hypothetical protein
LAASRWPQLGRNKMVAPGGEKGEACVKAGIDKVADQLK